MTNSFEGWYFKHQKNEDVLAFIPGTARNEAFIQMLSGQISRQFNIKKLTVNKDIIKADNCIFSIRGCHIDLPGIYGHLHYQAIAPLKYDIMGPFAHLPMQCSHGVISMNHSLTGSISIDGENHNFDGGNGYIEKDSGTSFPRSYMWIQSNDFSEPCSIMFSIAHIPFCFTSFTGCICAIIYKKEEYRFATYLGVHLHVISQNHICISQGCMFLEINIRPTHKGYELRSPVNGEMSGRIRESSNACIRVRLWKKGKQIIDVNTLHAMYECVPNHMT